MKNQNKTIEPIDLPIDVFKLAISNEIPKLIQEIEVKQRKRAERNLKIIYIIAIVNVLASLSVMAYVIYLTCFRK